MNVVCGQCGTEYEFDDALVSARGTTVKCTQCSHQFRVLPQVPSSRIAPERWVVRKPGGAPIEFVSLGELQRAIASRQVTLDDHFSKDGQPFRAMRDVAELLPFFQRSLAPAANPETEKVRPEPRQVSRTPVVPAAATAGAGFSPKGTLIGMQVPKRPRDPLKDTLASAIDTSHAELQLDRDPEVRRTPIGGLAPHNPPEPLRVPAPTVLPPEALGLAALGDPLVAERLAVLEPHEPDPPTVPLNLQPPPPPPPRAAPAAAIDVALAPESVGAALPRRERRSAGESSDEVTQVSVSDPPQSRAPVSGFPLPLSVPPPPKRASGMRWVVGLIALGAVGLLGATVGREYLGRFSTQKPDAPASDERVDALLASAGRQLDAGDLESAKADYDKASVLSDKHPGVLLGLARVEAIRADRLWLQLRLLPPEPSPTRETVASELRLRLTKLQAALTAAGAEKSDEAHLARLQVDALRLLGDVAAARARADGMSSDASAPETAYALGALDVSEQAPNWPTVRGRLETAVAGERGVGRARTLLIYVLIMSRDYEAAKRELERLNSAPVPHPLADELATFLGAQSQAFPAAGGATASDQAAGGGPGPAQPEDFRTHLERASEARNSGQLDRATGLYQAALRLEPGNVEALAGLADIAKRQGQTATAQSYYDQVLSKNPGFLPALMGLAEIKWATGDKAGAVKLYRRIGPDNMYSEKAQQRIEQFSHATPDVPHATDSENNAPKIDEADLPSPAASPAPDPGQPHIDTSDLPE